MTWGSSPSISAPIDPVVFHFRQHDYPQRRDFELLKCRKKRAHVLNIREKKDLLISLPSQCVTAMNANFAK